MSLVGGFGAPRINKVLSSTGYLTSVSKASYLRIIETVQMVTGACATLTVQPLAPGLALTPTCVHAWTLHRRARGAHADCMEAGGMKVGGCGWSAVLRVRLLHSAVRVRLGEQPKWDAAAWGVPINQEDLLVTQLAFSQVCLFTPLPAFP